MPPSDFLPAAARTLTPPTLPPPAADPAPAATGPLGTYDFDVTTGAADWSPAALAIYGGFDAPPTGVELRARVHPWDWPKLYAARRAAADHAAAFRAARGAGFLPPGADPDADPREESPAAPAPLPVSVLHRVVRPDGAVRWVRASGAYRFGPDGSVRRSTGVLEDVTEEVAAADRRAADLDRTRRALAAAGLGTFEFDLRTDLVLWDGRAKRLFGVPDSAPDRRPLADIVAAVHPDDRADAEAMIARALDPAGPGRTAAAHRFVTPDGAVRRIACRVEVEFAAGFAGRHAVRAVGVVEEVTDRPS